MKNLETILIVGTCVFVALAILLFVYCIVKRKEISREKRSSDIKDILRMSPMGFLLEEVPLIVDEEIQNFLVKYSDGNRSSDIINIIIHFKTTMIKHGYNENDERFNMAENRKIITETLVNKFTKYHIQ